MTRLCVTLVVLAGCSRSGGCDLERMITQDRYQAYEETSLFADGRVMRPPPAGTVARETGREGPLIELGYVGDRYAARIPIPVTRELMALGRRGYERVCATCHGLAGDGDSVVATRMQLKRPPSLVDRAPEPAGRTFRIINEGFGLMPAFGWMLRTDERWAVVAYEQALMLSQRARPDDLPRELRRRLP